MIYEAVVAVSTVILNIVPASTANEILLTSSTNLVNLRSHPPRVLVLSAFVQPSVLQLWVVAPLIWAYGLLQRWLGRGAVVVTAVLGHIGATLVVATILTAGIAHGRIGLEEAHATDVGVSYGLVAALALVTMRAPAKWRPHLVVGGTILLALVLLLGRSFTDLGHLAAWLLGLCLAFLISKALASRAPDQGASLNG